MCGNNTMDKKAILNIGLAKLKNYTLISKNLRRSMHIKKIVSHVTNLLMDEELNAMANIIWKEDKTTTVQEKEESFTGNMEKVPMEEEVQMENNVQLERNVQLEENVLLENTLDVNSCPPDENQMREDEELDVLLENTLDILDVNSYPKDGDQMKEDQELDVLLENSLDILDVNLCPQEEDQTKRDQELNICLTRASLFKQMLEITVYKLKNGLSTKKFNQYEVTSKRENYILPRSRNFCHTLPVRAKETSIMVQQNRLMNV